MRLFLAALVVFFGGFSAVGADTGAHPWGIGLQEGVTPVKDMIGSFHHELMWIMTAIVVLVLLLLAYVALRFNRKANPQPSKNTHNTLIEIIWTAIPALILIVIAVPSFRLLYYSDKDPAAEMTVKAIGRQWYWSYEYPDHGGIAFDSTMIPDDQIDASKGQKRLLEVDNRLVIPVNTSIRFLVTASDVIHSFAVPAFGIKKDAIPGRMNETWAKIEKEGVYYGQCSELCGSGHAFMPIAVEVVSKEQFAAWIKQKGGSMPQKTAAVSKE